MNFYVKRGDTATIRILTGANDPTTFTSLLFTVKESLGDADTSAVLQKANGYGITADAQGVTVALAHDDTKGLDAARMYHYDVQGQDGTRVVTLAQGQLRTSLDVTRELVQSIPIIQTDPVNPATLAAEVALRVSADASLSSAVSLETSRATSAEVSLTTRVSIEESTRLAQEALKADQSALDATNARTAGVTRGAVNADAPSHPKFSLSRNGVSDYELVVAPDGNLLLGRYLSGAWTHTPMAVNNATGAIEVKAGFLIDGRNALAAIDSKEPVIAAGSALQLLAGNKGLTTRLPRYTTAQLMALSQSDSEALGKADCSDCYNLTGQPTGDEVKWNYATSKWRLADCGVEVTRDALTFARGLRAAGVHVNTQGLVSLGFNGERMEQSGSGYAFRSVYDRSFGTATGMNGDGWSLVGFGAVSVENGAIAYAYGEIGGSVSTADDPIAMRFGAHYNTDDVYQYYGAILDPHDVLGEGAYPYLTASAKYDGTTSAQPSTIDHILYGTPVEVVRIGTQMSVYVSGQLVGSVFSNVLPNQWSVPMCLSVKRGQSGQNHREFRISNFHVCSF